MANLGFEESWNKIGGICIELMWEINMFMTQLRKKELF